jgi:hypothetical protein
MEDNIIKCLSLNYAVGMIIQTLELEYLNQEHYL